MKIRIVKPFNGYKVGQVFEWGDGMARVLVSRGVIEEVRGGVESASVEARAERADMPMHIKRRGK